MALNEAVAQVFRDFGRAQGVAMVVSSKVDVTVSASYPPMPAETFLDKVTQDNGLFWYDDGLAIYVHALEELETRIVQLHYATAEEVLDAIQQLDLVSPRLPIREANSKLLKLHGPARYIEAIESVIKQLDQSNEPNAQDQKLILEVFRLKYALADNYSYSYGTTQSVVPGVAAVLRNLISGDNNTGGGSAVQTSRTPYALPSLLGRGLIGAGEPSTPAKKPILPPAALNGQTAAQRPNQTALDKQPVITQGTYIQAEPRLNALIIRDTRENLDLYRQIIEALDVPNGMVQITASIVDVDTRNDLRWAPPSRLSWNASGKSTTIDFRVTPSVPAPNLVFNLISNSDMLAFMTQVQYLEERGDARVQSRPSVVTLSNTPAVLSSTETFFVRVAGAYQADLFNVGVGTRLQVVPLLIDQDNEKKVKLMLQINDGKVLDEDVEGVPRVRESTITTQAILHENESLLIGGMYRHEYVDNEHFIPKLSKVPVVGKLFRSFERNMREYQRLIVITPRRVNASDIMPNQPIPYAGDVLNRMPCPTDVVSEAADPGTVAPSNGYEETPPPPPAPAAPQE